MYEVFDDFNFMRVLLLLVRNIQRYLFYDKRTKINESSGTLGMHITYVYILISVALLRLKMSCIHLLWQKQCNECGT